MSGAAAWEPTAEDRAFCDVYGDWDPMTPAELRDLMDGFPAPSTGGKDDIDLASTWPLLDAEKRAWLRETVRRMYPDHPWQQRLDG